MINGVNFAGGKSIVSRDNRGPLERARDAYEHRKAVKNELRFKELQKKAEDGTLNKSEAFELGAMAAARINQGIILNGTKH